MPCVPRGRAAARRGGAMKGRADAGDPLGRRGPGPASPGRTRVKICGITNREDALMAIELGADALGFNGFPGSKRYIDLGREAAWIGALPGGAAKIAVLVNPGIEEVQEIAGMGLFDLIQLHGTEDVAFCGRVAAVGVGFIKALPAAAGTFEGVEELGAAAILLDTDTPRGFGGSGELLDLGNAAAFVAGHPAVKLIVSGGLRPGNVSEVVRRLRPYAVDVASGVESAPRRKDRGLLEEFLRAVAEAG